MENRANLNKEFERVNHVCDEKRKIVEKTDKEEDLENYLSSLVELTMVAKEILEKK